MFRQTYQATITSIIIIIQFQETNPILVFGYVFRKPVSNNAICLCVWRGSGNTETPKTDQIFVTLHVWKEPLSFKSVAN